MLGLNLPKLTTALREQPLYRYAGRLRSAHGIYSARLPASLYELCAIQSSESQSALVEVVGIENGVAKMMPYSTTTRISSDATVTALRSTVKVPCGDALLGRIVDGTGSPIDGQGPIRAAAHRDAVARVPNALTRRRIEQPLQTGLRAIDGLLTMGVGQRVGLFAGSGVGKSTLLGEIAKYSNADCNVIALIGERGREVRPFLEDCLGKTGLQRSVVVLATSDQTPLMRVRAVQTAVTMANEFRSQGQNVLFMLDSITRLAMAQREIGLLLGEPPTSRGYTPSVFQLLASTLEQLGNSEVGSVTALATVLVDGDDMNDPIADAVRSIVDGHIVLSRQLAERGHYPAIDVAASVSRTFTDVTSGAHQTAAQKIKRAYATYHTNADLIRAGAYQQGAAPDIDLAIELKPSIDAFLQQGIEDHRPFEVTVAELDRLASRWTVP